MYLPPQNINNGLATQDYTSLAESYYRIMQIVRGGKDSRFHDLLVIHEKTFVIVQQFETPYNKKKKIRWKTFAIGG